MEMLAGSVKDTGGVYFVTAFSGLLAPYWDQEASGTIIGLTAYTTSAHIARATLEAVCFQTRAVLDVIEKESGEKLDVLKVDGGVTNSDLAMQLQANVSCLTPWRLIMKLTPRSVVLLLPVPLCASRRRLDRPFSQVTPSSSLGGISPNLRLWTRSIQQMFSTLRLSCRKRIGSRPSEAGRRP